MWFYKLESMPIVFELYDVDTTTKELQWSKLFGK